jgi:KipI family sensor histidine kinase inhibitor
MELMISDHPTIRFLPCGDTAFSMEFGAKIDRAINAKVVALYKKAQHKTVDGIVELIPTFRSLLVCFDPEKAHPEELQHKLLAMLEDAGHDSEPGRRWTLPVCYEQDFGPDLADVAQETGLSADEVRNLHAQHSYFVYMIGFLPGYGYMGDLPEAIRVPRRTSPRTRVPRGSVAIARDMTAVYSLESPGGWHLIGRTPIKLFDPDAASPVLLAPGDIVSFESICSGDYAAIERDVLAGNSVIQPESFV